MDSETGLERPATGTVKWFNAQKGFGFIQSDEGGVDVFVRISAAESAGLRDLREGQKVSYEIAQDRRSGVLGRSAQGNLTQRPKSGFVAPIKGRWSRRLLFRGNSA